MRQRGGEMSTEMVVDRTLSTEIVELKVFCERGSVLGRWTLVCTDLVRGPY